MDCETLQIKKADKIIADIFSSFFNDLETYEYNCPKHGLVTAQYRRNSQEIYCPLCEDEKEADKKNEEERRKKERSYYAMGIREKHFGASFAAFIPPNEKAKRYLEKIKRLSESPKDKIMLLYGKSGTGKTMLLSAAVKQNKGLYTTWEWLSMEIRASYSNAAKKTEHDIFRNYCTVPFLAIDEIEKGTGSETKRNMLSFICRERYENNLPLWLAGNCNNEWVDEMFDTAVMDRLKHCGISLDFDWESYRGNLKSEAL